VDKKRRSRKLARFTVFWDPPQFDSWR